MVSITVEACVCASRMRLYSIQIDLHMSPPNYNLSFGNRELSVERNLTECDFISNIRQVTDNIGIPRWGDE